MANRTKDPELPEASSGGAYESCPHCGEALSPWQQVLLAVDRALVCRRCWYRIILEAPEDKGGK